VAKFGGDLPTVIGAGVTVGSKAIIHACTLQDGCYVGAGATVLDGATVEAGAVLAAGALAAPRSVIPAGQVSLCIVKLVLFSTIISVDHTVSTIIVASGRGCSAAAVLLEALLMIIIIAATSLYCYCHATP
jgi:carbonic anhydrase/acetyltransferase-like protein (isoleucine patch superfamily)